MAMSGAKAETGAQLPYDPAQFDPIEQPTPHVFLARVRQSDQSAFFVPRLGAWCVTRYDDVVRALSDYDIFSSSKMVRVWAPPPETAADLPDGHPLEGAPVTIDPPRHTRIRKLEQKAFTPALIAAREPAIRALVDRVADTLAGKGSADLIQEFCSIIPPRVVSQLLGVPEEDSATFRKWAVDAHRLGFPRPNLTEADVVRLSREMVHFDKYVRALIADRRAHPQEDLTTYLVQAQGDEGEAQLTDKELISIIASLVTAGSDTTSSLIGHAMHVVLTTPDIRRQIEADRTLIDNLIEETLRVYPSARALRRTTRCPVHIGGTEVPEDATIMVHIASANRDASVFPEPDRFDLHRANAKRHMSFGVRTHFCLGAPLARLEAKLAINTLLDRFPTLRLASGSDLTAESYDDNMFIPSLEHLPVVWDVASERSAGAKA
jgi:cytochrome P450